MNVSLTPELDEFVEKKVKTGGYASASEVIREGLRLIIEKDELKFLEQEHIRNQILLSIKEVEEGNFTSYNSPKELADEIISEGRKKLKSN